MSVADLHDLELIWPSSLPADVIVTGTFDQWSSSIHLVKGDTGFVGTVKVPWGEKVAYKFIVDGFWRCRDDRPQENDGHGNMNNVLRTPEKPLAVFPEVYDPPARLSIPPEGVQSEGNGDIETMVTAVEFLFPAEPTVVRGSLPIPQISVEGLASVDTPVSVSKLDTTAATEGTVPPASEIPAELVPFKHAPSSGFSILPVINNGSVSYPPVNGDGKAHDLYSFATHAPIQFIKGEPLASPSVLETAPEGVFAPLESAVPESNHSPQDAQDVPAPIDRADVPPTLTPVVISEPTAKQPEVDLANATQGHRRPVTPSTSFPSTSASNTLTHKKRQSLLVRIKHIFGRDNDKRERKEKKKH